MRVVLDTNILISACWTRGGLEDRAVNLVLKGTLIACASDEVLAEYRDVLSRKKFEAVQVRASDLLRSLEAHVFKVKPVVKITAASDEDDNRFLECAFAAHAEYIITGNLKHYPVDSGNTKIVNARQFFDRTGIC
jgi:uncharacterized protein